MDGISSCEDSSSSADISTSNEVPDITIEAASASIFTELLELKKYDDGYQVLDDVNAESKALSLFAV